MTEATPEVLVIGAGINGAGTFRDLALQGVDVLLVERGDICSGSSSAPSRMIHGGLRYLEFGEFRLVREALRERDLLLHTARHLVRPLPTFIPVRSWAGGAGTVLGSFFRVDVPRPAQRGGLLLRAGLALYDRYTASRRTLPSHEFLDRDDALERWPHLPPDIVGVARYHDAWISHPERLGLEVVLDGIAAGGEVRTYAEAIGVEAGAVLVKDLSTGVVDRVRPRVVVNAAGPWIDEVNRTIDPGSPRRIGGTKGSHVILDHPALHEFLAGEMLYHETDDGRTSLLLPWHGRVIAGTTDIRVDDADEVTTTDEEVDYILAATREVVPGLEVGREQVVSTYVGVRPLPWAGEDVATVRISRDHSLSEAEPTDRVPFPVLSMVGGKWTTFRAFAEVATDAALDRLGRRRVVHTEPAEIGGARGHPSDETAWIAQVADRTGLTPRRVAVLLERYGSTAARIAEAVTADDRPLPSHSGYSPAELAWIAGNELVVHLDDLLDRRTTIAVLGEARPEVVADVAAAIAPVLGWDRGTTEAEVERATAILGRRHRVV